MNLRDLAFCIRYGFRGYPVMMGNHGFRVDESLRRWNFDGECEVRNALEKSLKPGDTAIDIGANFGMHTLLMAKCVTPNGRVIAFEPIPENARLCQRNIDLNQFGSIVSLRQLAISDLGVDELEMEASPHAPSLTAGIATSSTTTGSTTRVKNTSLDSVCEAMQIHGECLIKIDVEGAELSVLRSGKEFIQRIRPKLLIEVHTYALPSFGGSVEEVNRFLHENGYDVTPLAEVEHSIGNIYYIIANRK